METVAQVLQETIEKARPVMGKKGYTGVVSRANRAVVQAISQQIMAVQKTPKKRFTKQTGEEICKRMERGKTLATIAQELDIDISTIYYWLDDDSTGLSEAYKRSKKLMTRTLVDKLVAETESLKSEDALAARVRSDVVKWVASRLNPEEFSDIKRIELKGEINHKHTHELAPEQKRRIAESWLISQEQDVSLPAITAETSGPDLPALEGVAVHEICETEQGERPKRKRSEQSSKATASGKQRGRPRKVKLGVDDRVD